MVKQAKRVKKFTAVEAKKRARLRRLARSLDEALYHEDGERKQKIQDLMDRVERGATERALDAWSDGKSCAAPWISTNQVDMVTWFESSGSSGRGWFYRFADELRGTAYGPYRTRAGARAAGRRRAAARGY